jgi:hypothetical protein
VEKVNFVDLDRLVFEEIAFSTIIYVSVICITYLANEFVCKLGSLSLWHEWASLKRE